jgi:hypothetical protein
MVSVAGQGGEVSGVPSAEVLRLRPRGPLPGGGPRNQCHGCVWCCVMLEVEVPQAGADGQPLPERRVKARDEPCPWIGVVGGVLGCSIHGHQNRSWACDAYECPELYRLREQYQPWSG